MDPVIHMVKEQARGVITPKCGQQFKASNKNVGTIWLDRVTCKACLRTIKEERTPKDDEDIW